MGETNEENLMSLEELGLGDQIEQREGLEPLGELIDDDDDIQSDNLEPLPQQSRVQDIIEETNESSKGSIKEASHHPIISSERESSLEEEVNVLKSKIIELEAKLITKVKDIDYLENKILEVRNSQVEEINSLLSMFKEYARSKDSGDSRPRNQTLFTDLDVLSSSQPN